MDELLNKVAELRGMPASLVLRSAEARAKSEGIPVEQVLAEWAGEPIPEGGSAPTEVAAEAAPPAEAQEPAAPEPAAPPAAAGSFSKAELLEQAAEERGMPSSLVERSAEARAKSEGITVEQVLAEWAGVQVTAVTEAGPAEPAPAAEAPAVVEEPVALDAATPAPQAVPKIEVLEAAEPIPVDSEADDEDEEEEEVLAARSRYPALLGVAFVIIPLMAVLYILAIPNGPSCGSSGQLAVDPVSGEAVGCDGNAYGEEVGGSFAAGETLYGSLCSACHGATGEGGAGPAMAGGAVLATFPAGQCSTHVEWVTLGSSGWQSEVGNTYGANDATVNGGMPNFGSQLDAEQISQIVLYERVAFGGEALGEAESGCFAADEDGVAALGD